MRLVAILLSAAALVVLGIRLRAHEETPEPPAPVAMPAVGEVAPPFALLDAHGRRVEVGGPSTSWRIVVFYRAAASPW